MDKHKYRQNKPQREQWYQDLAIGMYVYWTVDAQLGMVNAHSVIGASSDYYIAISMTYLRRSIPNTSMQNIMRA